MEKNKDSTNTWMNLNVTNMCVLIGIALTLSVYLCICVSVVCSKNPMPKQSPENIQKQKNMKNTDVFWPKAQKFQRGHHISCLPPDCASQEKFEGFQLLVPYWRWPDKLAMPQYKERPRPKDIWTWPVRPVRCNWIVCKTWCFAIPLFFSGFKVSTPKKKRVKNRCDIEKKTCCTKICCTIAPFNCYSHIVSQTRSLCSSNPLLVGIQCICQNHHTWLDNMNPWNTKKLNLVAFDTRSLQLKGESLQTTSKYKKI